jgi:hypothetical protein
VNINLKANREVFRRYLYILKGMADLLTNPHRFPSHPLSSFGEFLLRTFLLWYTVTLLVILGVLLWPQ